MGRFNAIPRSRPSEICQIRCWSCSSPRKHYCYLSGSTLITTMPSLQISDSELSEISSHCSLQAQSDTDIKNIDFKY